MNEPMRLATSGSPLAKQLLRAARRERPSAESRVEAIAAAALITSTRRPWIYMLGSKPWLALLCLCLFSTGLVAAVWVVESSRPAEATVRTDPIERAEMVPSDVPARVPESFSIEADRPAPARAPVVSATEPSAATPRPTEPPAELALLRSARIALAGGDFARALALLDEHESFHPRGALREEAAALRVEVLARAGDTHAARAAAARFERLHPESPYVERVRSIAARLPPSR